MFGDETYAVTQVDGTTLHRLRWDSVVFQDLFIEFTVTSIDGTTAPNIEAIRTGLVTSFAPGVNEEVNINGLATQVQDIDANTLVTDAGFSDRRDPDAHPLGRRGQRHFQTKLYDDERTASHQLER
jgi:hypothetical protein